MGQTVVADMSPLTDEKGWDAMVGAGAYVVRLVMRVRLGGGFRKRGCCKFSAGRPPVWVVPVDGDTVGIADFFPLFHSSDVPHPSVDELSLKLESEKGLFTRGVGNDVVLLHSLRRIRIPI